MNSDEINVVSIIGSGTMGTGIAQTFASSGLSVLMIDVDQDRLDKSVSSIEGNLHLYQEFDLINEEPDDILSRIKTTTAVDLLSATSECGFVIETVPDVVEKMRRLMLKTGKKPVIVKKTVPGFIINRLTGAMEREIDYLIDEDIVTPEDLDTAVKASYGFRLACMGPMAQEDMIGLDTSARVSANVFKQLSTKTTPSPLLLAKVEKGELGIKSGKGWYDYSDRSIQQINDQINRRLLQQLALFRSVEE